VSFSDLKGPRDARVRQRLRSIAGGLRAVRAYQDVVLELQSAESLDPAALQPVLKRAAAAKGVVNQYRNAHRSEF
jgi:hypothetical protein